MVKITINRHLGDQNNNQIAIYLPFQHLGNTYITINRHLGD